MQAAGVREALAGLRAAYDALAACDLDGLTVAQRLEMLDELQVLECQLPTQWHRGLAGLIAETDPKALGAKSWNEVLRVRWRLSTAEAGRRLGEAADLGPRRALTGQPLDPVLPAVAAARGAGLITGEHVKVLRETMRDIPTWVDATTRSQMEVELVRIAVGIGPTELKETAALRLFLLDQDGPEPDDTETARKRGLSLGKQGRDKLTRLTANLDPEAAAVWEVLLAHFAAPGMCNPADAEPCTAGTPTQAQIDNDHRSLEQRQHDALVVIGRIALMSDLGQLNGLPVSVIIRTTLQDLESRAGVGTTGGGTIVPIKDVVRMAAHANHHLAVFDRATGSALAHFRGRRTASAAQRIMLIARDGGCTKPCCTVGAYGSQAHHAVADWAAGGNTNVDEMALACGTDNRSVEQGGWTTRMNARTECEWIPPEHLDTGQTRINYHHRPEALLHPPDDESETPKPPLSPPTPRERDSGPDIAAPPPKPPTLDDDGTESEPFALRASSRAAGRIDESGDDAEIVAPQTQTSTLRDLDDTEYELFVPRPSLESAGRIQPSDDDPEIAAPLPKPLTPDVDDATELELFLPRPSFQAAGRIDEPGGPAPPSWAS